MRLHWAEKELEKTYSTDNTENTHIIHMIPNTKYNKTVTRHAIKKLKVR